MKYAGTGDTHAMPTGSGSPSDPVVQTSHVIRRYPGIIALNDVNFEVRPGEVRALLGKNGAGKSTLIRLMSGVERPDAGTVTIGGVTLTGGGSREASALGVATVYQELSLVPQLSVAENYHLGALPINRYGLVRTAQMKEAVHHALDQLGVRVDPNTPVGALPVAEQQMIEIARAMKGSARLLILDEPTSSLAAAEADIVLEAVTRIAQRGIAIIYVSHRLSEIRQVAETASVMRDGRLVKTVPTKGSSASDIIELMLGQAQPELPELTFKAAPTGAEQPVALSVRNLAVPPKVRDVSFSLRQGEILGIAGVLGSGRSEVLRSIAGLNRPSTGTVAVFGETLRRWSVRSMIRRGVGLTPEERKTDGIVPLLGVDENIVLADQAATRRGPLLSPRRRHQAADELVAKLSIRTPSVTAPIGTLSGGNQQKAVIARWLHRRSRILLLDEPTRGIDVQAKGQIYALVKALADQGVSIVFVSSELEELALVCTRVIVMRDGTISSELSGTQITEAAIFDATLSDSRSAQPRPLSEVKPNAAPQPRTACASNEESS